MGMDVGYENGVVITVDAFLGAISVEHMETIQQVVLPRFVEDKPDFAAQTAQLQQTNDIRAFRSLLRSLCGDEFENADQLLDLFQKISWVTYPVYVAQLEYFTSSRRSGDEVPLREPVVVFEEGDCFETVLTPKGKALGRVLRQEVERSTWTWVSE